jgi:FlaA1/EpsC-like NDP-sugar epimerase
VGCVSAGHGRTHPISEPDESTIKLARLTVRRETNPAGDIASVVRGKRPDEKMYEELFYDTSTANITEHARIMRVRCGHRKRNAIYPDGRGSQERSLVHQVLFGPVDTSS